MVALQSQYAPRSQGSGIDTVTPTNMTTALALSLERVEQVTGLDIDTYVATKLGIDREALFERYAAEQIDTLAITYLNLERGKVTLIGNDTGTGKGRIVCGLIQSVIAPIELPDLSRASETEKQQALSNVLKLSENATQANQVAVFLTAKPELYVDMLGRDMVDTGIKGRVRPFFTNAALDLELKSPDGATIGFIRTGSTAEQSREMRRLIDEFRKTGKIDRYNVIFTTYDQLKEKGSIRRQFIEAIAPAATFILDECDLGGGASGPRSELTAGQKREQEAGGDIRSTSAFLADVVLPASRNYALLSATAFKDPYVLTRLLYPKSEIQQTGLSVEALAGTLVKQGTPAQQDFTSKLAMAGELVRLEKSMEGIEFAGAPVQVNLDKFEQSIRVMRLIVNFDRAKKSAVEILEEAAYVRAEQVKAVDPSAGEASIHSTLFSSTAYNFAQQLLFALSSEGIANEAIAEIEAGRKPIIGFYNTMQSALEFYLEARYNEIFTGIKATYREQHFDQIRLEHPDVAPEVWEELFDRHYFGQISTDAKREYQAWIAAEPVIDLNVGDLLLRQLEKCRLVTIGDPYGDKRRYRMTDEELGAGAMEIVAQIQHQVETLDWSGIPISPIDDIIQRIRDRGYGVAEMSGRSLGLDYSSGLPRLKTVEARDVQTRTDAKAAFNNGSVDVLITNITTGWSGHASRTFQDQRRRVLIVGQAHPDVNKFVQLLGRGNRTGQLNPAKHAPDQVESGRPTWGQVTERHGIPGDFGLPQCKLVIAEGVPYVQRIVSEMNRKMDSLNANTTGNRTSAQSFDGPSFSNRAGDIVASQLLEDDSELNEALDYPLVNTESNEGAAKKVTGRAIFLPLDQQARLFEALNDRFHAYVAQQEALGESPIEQKTLDLQAQTQARLELVEAQSKSVLFGGSVTVERMLIRALQKPYSTEQIRSEILSRLGLAEIPVQSNDFAAGSTLRQAAIGQIETRLDSEDDRVVQQIEEYKQKINQLATQIEPKAKLLQSKTEIQSEITELSEQAKDQQISEFERKGFEKQISQKQAQFKKIESQLKKLAKHEVSYTNLQSRRHDLETRWASVRDAISKFQPGQSVSIRTSNGAMYGIILNCQRNENVKSPVAGSSWKFSIAVVDSSRELTLAIGDVVSATGFTTIQLQPVEFGVRVDPSTGDISLLSIPEMFDRSQSETHELREMLTGNLLNAKSGGKYVSFTTVEGVVRQGILLPRESDVEKELAAAPVTIANPLQAQQLLNEGAVLGTQDKLKLEQSSQFFEGKHQRGIEVSVSASRRGGGHYYTDVELLKFTRNREGKPGFAKHSDKMKSFVPDENLEAFLRYLIANGRELQVTQTAFKDRAREITGQELKTFTASSGDEQGMAEFRISVEEIRAEIDQHRIRSTDSVEDPIEFDESIDNVELLTLAYQQHFSEGGQFQDIRAARQFGIEQLERHGRSTELLDRTIEECIESSIVRYAKDLAAIEDMNSLDRFDTLVELYHRQPNLSARTSNSILLQQYSTPVPLGLLVQELAHIQTAQTVWEPTAGNGALLTATPSSTQVIANEIDSNRANQLRRQGYEVTERDATEASLSEPVDVVVANPPFGKSNDLTGAPKQWQIDLGQNPAPGTRAYPTTQLDHAIAFKALSVMKDQGRAVLVLGAPMAQKVGANAASAYNGNDKRAFFYTLYQNYNVTQHFTASGDLYSKQGTSFPVDIIVIEGRGKSQLPLPAAQIPPVYREWAELREIFVQTLEQRKILEANQSPNVVKHLEAQLPVEQMRPISAETASPNQSNADILPTQIEPAQINLPDEQSDPVAIIQLRPVREQSHRLEQQAAKFLFDSGIAEAILKDDRFTLGVERDPYQPLAIQCHDNRLSFTRCRELPDGGFVLDSEAVFQVEPTGHLRFVEVASPMPIGDVLRSPDQAFAVTLIRALHEDGFVEATQIAYQQTQPEAIAIRLANSISSLLGRELNTVRAQPIELDGIDYVFESGRLLTSGRRFYAFVSVIDVSSEIARPVFSVEDMDNDPIATVFDQSRLKRLRSEVESEDFVVFLPDGFEERFMTIAELTENVAVLGANRLNVAANVERDQQGGLNLEAVQFTSEPPALDRLNRFIAGVGENEVVPLTQEFTEIERQLTELWGDDCAAVAQSVAAQQPEMDLFPDSYSQALMPILEQIKTLLESANWQPIREWATPDWISKSDIARQVALAIYVQERDQVFERSLNDFREYLWRDPDLQTQTEALRIDDEQNARIGFEQRFNTVFQDWFNADEAQNLRYYRAILNDSIQQSELCDQLFEEWKIQVSIPVTSTSIDGSIAALAQQIQTDLVDLTSADSQNRRIAFDVQFDQSLLQIRTEHLQLYRLLSTDPIYKSELRDQLFQQWNDAISKEPVSALAELQNRYPDYSFNQSTSGLNGRHSSTLLFAYDPDGSIAAHINVSQYGKLAYAEAQSQIERHEIIRATAPLPALRAEFPELRFEREITRVGILVRAFDKTSRNRVAVGRISDENDKPTPHQLAEFFTTLRDRGYSTGIVPDSTATSVEATAENFQELGDRVRLRAGAMRIVQIADRAFDSLLESRSLRMGSTWYEGTYEGYTIRLESGQPSTVQISSANGSLQLTADAKTGKLDPRAVCNVSQHDLDLWNQISEQLTEAGFGSGFQQQLTFEASAVRALRLDGEAIMSNQPLPLEIEHDPIIRGNGVTLLLQLNETNLPLVYTELQQELIEHDQKLSPNRASELAAARLWNGLQTLSNQIEDKADQHGRGLSSTPLTTAEEQFYDRVFVEEWDWKTQIIDLSKTRTVLDDLNHPYAQVSVFDSIELPITTTHVEQPVIVLQDSALEALRQIDSLPFPLNHYLPEKIAHPDAIVLIQDPALGCYVGFGEVATTISEITGGATRTMEIEAVAVAFCRIPTSKITEVTRQIQLNSEVLVVHSQHDRETFPHILVAQENAQETSFLSVDNPTLIFEGGTVTFSRGEIEEIAELFALQHQQTQIELGEALKQVISSTVPSHLVEAALTALIEDDRRLTQSVNSPIQPAEVTRSDKTIRVDGRTVLEADDWNALIDAQEKPLVRGQKTALDRLNKFENRIKEVRNSVPRGFDGKALKITLQALKEATATPSGQKLLLELDSRENAALDGQAFASWLVQAATEMRRSFVAEKLTVLEPLLQDLQQRYPSYQFQRSNFSRTEGEDYPHITVLDAASQRITSLYLVEATPKTIEKAEAQLRDHQGTVAQSTVSLALPDPEYTKVRPAEIDQLRNRLNALQTIVERIESGQNLEPDRTRIDQTISIAIGVFDKFRELAATANVNADLVFTELLGGTQPVSELLASVQAWEQKYPASEVELNGSALTTGHAIVATEWGDLTATVTLCDDNCLQIEVTGRTANCYDYPSSEYVSYVGLDQWSAMSPEMHDFDIYARFVAEEQHKQFLHQIDQERVRIQPEINRWLNRKPEIERQLILTSAGVRDEFINEFLSIYPERDRIDSTIEFRRLVIASMIAPDHLIELLQSDIPMAESKFEGVSPTSTGVEEETQQLSLLQVDSQTAINESTPSHTSPTWDHPTTVSQSNDVQRNEANRSNQDYQIQAESPLSIPKGLEAHSISDENARDQEIRRNNPGIHSQQQDLAMAQEILGIAERCYAYGGSIKKIHPDLTQQTWTFATKGWDISFTLPNIFSITGRDEAAMRLVTVDGTLSIDQSFNLNTAVLKNFQELACKLERKGFISQETPAQIQAQAQQEWERTHLDRPVIEELNIAAESAEAVQSTLFTVAQFESFLPIQEQHGGSFDPSWVEMEELRPELIKPVPASQVAIKTISAINPEAANQLAPMLQSSSSSSTIDQLRQWWKQALEIGRPSEHLQKIKEVGVAVKAGTRQPAVEDLSQMQRDQEKWQQVQTLVAQAHRFLNHIGQDEFQKDNYRIQRSSTQLTITDISEGRGDIVRVDGETLRSKVMKKDIERFAAVDKIVQKLQRTPASTAMPSHGSVLAEHSS